MRTFLRQTLALVYPFICPLCAGRLPEQHPLPICDDCQRSLPRQWPPFCRRCGASLPGDWQLAATCARCLEEVSPAAAERLLAPYALVGGARASVHRIKYEGRRRLAAYCARQLAAFARRHLMDDPLDAVVPVPLHWRRLLRRGYNQAEWLAAAVAEELGVPLEQWLVRRRPTPTQVHRRRAARLANLSDAFAVGRAARARLPGARVLLVDDVITTGATAEACARTLRSGGATSVTVLALARTPGSGERPAVGFSR